MNKILVFIFLLVVFLFLPTTNYPLLTAHAIVDPLEAPNNKFGVHIISATPGELSAASEMVNFNGDWGYVTFLIESKNRDQYKWQQFFNELRRQHLIPIVRIATKPVNSHWERPYEGEEKAWADFLDSLNWPTKNRYVVIYNEPNHAKEWGNFVDPKSYAIVLNKTITALKEKNQDFFVLNCGFDSSAPHQPPEYYDEERFLREMDEEIPGIFNRLDGWVSHPYPNPNFSGSPDSFGRGTVRGYLWEISLLRDIGLHKNLPIFITETGWKHQEGLKTDPNLLNAEETSVYYRKAYEEAWNSDQIVAVTPFLLNYQEEPFDHFSFKKITGEVQNDKILPAGRQVLGVQFPEYYPQYTVLRQMPKVSGQPLQDIKAEFVSYDGSKVTFKNTGQSIWGERGEVKIAPFEPFRIPVGTRIEPNQEYIHNLSQDNPKVTTTITPNFLTELFENIKAFLGG